MELLSGDLKVTWFLAVRVTGFALAIVKFIWRNAELTFGTIRVVFCEETSAVMTVNIN